MKLFRKVWIIAAKLLSFLAGRGGERGVTRTQERRERYRRMTFSWGHSQFKATWPWRDKALQVLGEINNPSSLPSSSYLIPELCMDYPARSWRVQEYVSIDHTALPRDRGCHGERLRMDLKWRGGDVCHRCVSFPDNKGTQLILSPFSLCLPGSSEANRRLEQLCQSLTCLLTSFVPGCRSFFYFVGPGSVFLPKFWLLYWIFSFCKPSQCLWQEPWHMDNFLKFKLLE